MWRAWHGAFGRVARGLRLRRRGNSASLWAGRWLTIDGTATLWSLGAALDVTAVTPGRSSHASRRVCPVTVVDSGSAVDGGIPRLGSPRPAVKAGSSVLL